MKTRRRILPSGWYPASARECARDIEEFLQGFEVLPGNWIGGIAPHAGWYFSGRAAARLLRTLSSCGPVDRVIVYGGHLPGDESPIVYTEDSWETPFGHMPMDLDLSEELIGAGEAVAAPGGFADNTVEVLLPFVRHFYPEALLVAVHSPSSERAVKLGLAVQAIVARQNLRAAYVGSADLTHYGPNYGFTSKGSGSGAVQWVKEENDRSLIDKALAMDAAGVIKDARTRKNTCSAGPIASVIVSAGRHGVESGTLLEYYTSYDIAPNSSFVGYAAILF
ncbi:MAG: AmmeMemoRadiSam system protein B [Thermodesulfobacteriota bacterium]